MFLKKIKLIFAMKTDLNKRLEEALYNMRAGENIVKKILKRIKLNKQQGLIKPAKSGLCTGSFLK